MTAREHLERYGQAMKRDDRLKEELEMLRTRWTSATAQISDMPKGPGGRHDLAEYAAVADAILSDRKRNLDDAARIREEILAAIDRIPDETEQNTLYYRYICLMRWEEIAVKLMYDYRYVLKIHGRALQHYKPPEE